jgi:hypothetical protein
MLVTMSQYHRKLFSCTFEATTISVPQVLATSALHHGLMKEGFTICNFLAERTYADFTGKLSEWLCLVQVSFAVFYLHHIAQNFYILPSF